MVVEGLLGQGKPQLVMLNFKLVFLLEGYVTSHATYGHGSSYLLLPIITIFRGITIH